MEALGVLFLSFFIFLVLGLVFVSLNALNAGFLIPALILAAILLSKVKEGGEEISLHSALTKIRLFGITFSIAILLPVFTRYLVDLSRNELWGIIAGFVIGYVALIWSMFVRENRTLSYGNFVGGAITLVYVYFQLWDLGELPRIIASAFALLVAVVISVIKLKDKLT